MSNSEPLRTSTRNARPSAKQRQIDLDHEMKELEARQKAIRAAIRDEHEQEERRGYSPNTRLYNPDVESEDEDDGYVGFSTGQFAAQRVETGPSARSVARNGNIVPVRPRPVPVRTNMVGVEVPQRLTVNLRQAEVPLENPTSSPTRPASSLPASSPPPSSPIRAPVRKRKSASDLDDDSDDQPGATTITMKKVKVTIPAAKGSRHRYNVSDFEEQGVVKEVLEDAIGVFRALVSTKNGFPSTGLGNELAMEAWIDVCKRRKIEVDCEPICAKLIRQRASQMRGQLKTAARPIVENLFGLANPALAKRDLRDKVEMLLERSAFIYKDPENRKGIFQHPSLQAIVNQTWFKNAKDDGPTHPQQFSPDGKLPLATIGLVFTAIECILDQWVTGEFVELKFAASVYQEKYDAHIANLEAFEKKSATSKIIPQLCEHLLKAARRHAKVTDIQHERHATFTDDDINAAVDDWKEFPPSDAAPGQDD